MSFLGILDIFFYIEILGIINWLTDLLNWYKSKNYLGTFKIHYINFLKVHFQL